MTKNWDENKLSSKQPWSKTWYQIRRRCNSKSHSGYSRYGGRGIKADISKDELRTLWLRDNASEMLSPTIDRIDTDGNYVFENCRYLERRENVRREIYKRYSKRSENDKCNYGHRLTEDNVYWYGVDKKYRMCKTCCLSWGKKSREKRKVIKNG